MTLREDGADPTLITFEITETALTEHPQEASAFATQSPRSAASSPAAMSSKRW
jgi:EAL domain-containing protein (putative c-di-GMP-specific phosphodiesterase class I)